jgi:hypothetical protein
MRRAVFFCAVGNTVLYWRARWALSLMTGGHIYHTQKLRGCPCPVAYSMACCMVTRRWTPEVDTCRMLMSSRRIWYNVPNNRSFLTWRSNTKCQQGFITRPLEGFSSPFFILRSSLDLSKLFPYNSTWTHTSPTNQFASMYVYNTFTESVKEVYGWKDR